MRTITSDGRVYWTATESAQVEFEVKRLVAMKWRGPFAKLLERAQEDLPEDRRRTPLSLMTCRSDKWKLKTFKNSLSNLKVIPAPSQPITGITPPKIEIPKKVEAAVQQNAGLINALALETVVVGMIGQSLPELLKAEVSRAIQSINLESIVIKAFTEINIRQRVEEELTRFTTKLCTETVAFMDLLQGVLNERAQTVQTTQSEPVIPTVSTVPAVKEEKIGKHFKIGIVNVLPNQVSYINKELGKYNLDITFYYTDGKSDANINPRHDKVFLMTKFLQHTKQETVKRLYQGKDIVYINGGLSQLQQKVIHTLYPAH